MKSGVKIRNFNADIITDTIKKPMGDRLKLQMRRRKD